MGVPVGTPTHELSRAHPSHWMGGASHAAKEGAGSSRGQTRAQDRARWRRELASPGWCGRSGEAAQAAARTQRDSVVVGARWRFEATRVPVGTPTHESVPVPVGTPTHGCQLGHPPMGVPVGTPTHELSRAHPSHWMGGASHAAKEGAGSSRGQTRAQDRARWRRELASSRMVRPVWRSGSGGRAYPARQRSGRGALAVRGHQGEPRCGIA